MTEELKEIKRVLDIPVEHYLECDIPDSDRDQIQEVYDRMFRKFMEMERLLDVYRQDYIALKQSYIQLRKESIA